LNVEDLMAMSSVANARPQRAKLAVAGLIAVSLAAVFATTDGTLDEPRDQAGWSAEAAPNIFDPAAAALDPLPRVEIPASARVARVEADWKQRAMVQYLARRYRLAADAAADVVGAAYTAGQRVGLDPLLILAVMAVESRFNPVAESHMGAKGLMQIIPRFHLEKLAPFGGAAAVLDPDANVHVGARILKEYIRAGGSLESGLLLYNGSSDDSEAVYAQKVMAERQRIEEALSPRAKAASSPPAVAPAVKAGALPEVATLAKAEDTRGAPITESVHALD
jgi:soluble lytic murein transglycosylase-like protein